MAMENQMFVKLGSMSDPRTFWATELPNTNTLAENGKHYKILKIEDILTKTMTEDYSNPDRFIRESTDLGTLVAVRKSSLSSLWFRGRLDQICLVDSQLVAKVFLIDYGEVLDRTQVSSCVRKLPNFMARDNPLAFQIILRALVPVTQDLDFQMGIIKMETVPVKSFDFAAVKFVNSLLNTSTKCGELCDFICDRQGRLHGQLFIRKEDVLIHLNDELIEAKFAVENQDQWEKDLSQPPLLPVLSKRESVNVSDSDDDPSDYVPFSSPDLKWYEKVITNEDVGAPLSPSSVSNSSWRTSDSLGRGQRLKKDVNPSVGAIQKITAEPPNPRGRLADLQKLMRNRKSKTPSNTTVASKAEPPTSQFNKMVHKMKICDMVENKTDVWTDLRKDAPDMKEGSYVIPGGVIQGKFHEALLRSMPQGKCAGPRTPQELSQFISSNGQFSIVKSRSSTQKVKLDLEKQIYKGNFQ